MSIMVKQDLLLAALTIALGDPEMAEALLKAFSKGEVETMELIELLGMNPADVRRMLYRLHDLNLAFQIVRKGEEGERLVFWCLNEKIAPSFVEKRLKRTKKILEEEKKNFIDRWVELKRRIRTETIPPKSMFGSNPKLPPFTEKDRVKFHDCLT